MKPLSVLIADVLETDPVGAGAAADRDEHAIRGERLLRAVLLDLDLDAGVGRRRVR